MKTRTRLVAFAAAASLVFGGALLIGRAVGPAERTPTQDGHTGHDPQGMLHDETTPASARPGGLAMSEDGYTLSLLTDSTEPGHAAPVGFVITNADGNPLTAYDVEHEKQLHLVAVRRDFSGFQHVHPTLHKGVWKTELNLTPGSWRLFADFKPAGADRITLGVDLAVSGDFQPVAPALEARTARVDGYQVTLDGDLTAGDEAAIILRVSKSGKPVNDLQPYLGAYGHLVALRAGDLAYLHVHPDGEPGDGTTKPGPDVVFHAHVPTAGTYHLYLDFKHGDVVRTAAFTVTVTVTATAADADADADAEGSDGHSH